MKRIMVMVLRNILFVPWWFIQLCLYAREKDNHSPEDKLALLKKIVRNANKGGRVTVKGYGQENLPDEDGFMLYPNHQGMYDVLAIIDTCDRPFSVVMKKEVENVPVLKQVLKMINALAMDRSDIRQSMGVIMEVTKRVKTGQNYAIFPEGTRSKNGNQLLEFKGGSFKAAVKAKCPIVPVVLINAFEPFDSHSLKPVTVQIHYLPPLYYDEYKDMKTTEIAEEVKKRIQKEIKKFEISC